MKELITHNINLDEHWRNQIKGCPTNEEIEFFENLSKEDSHKLINELKDILKEG